MDSHSGQSYEHRRGWLEEKLLALPQTFAINIAAYAIMSNRYHVVLHIDKQQADQWSDLEEKKIDSQRMKKSAEISH